MARGPVVAPAEVPTAGRGRPRDPGVDRAILDAVAGLLVERGFDGVTMEEVAVRAGVSKASVYRRYPCRTDLLTAACHAFAPAAREAPDSGSTRDDLVELLGSLARMVTSDAGRVIPALLAASAVNPEARDALARFTASRRSPTLEVVRRGIERGDLPEGTDPEVVADLLGGAVLYRVLVRGDAVRRPRLGSYVDAVLAAGQETTTASPTRTVPGRTTSA